MLQLPGNGTMLQQVDHYLPIPLAHTILAHEHNVSVYQIIRCLDFI